MSNVAIIFTGNDTVLEVANLVNQMSGVSINDAAVSATLRDSLGGEVDGMAWPVALAYVSASKGVYRVTLPYSLELSAGGRYTADVVADGGAGLRASWSVECVARARG